MESRRESVTLEMCSLPVDFREGRRSNIWLEVIFERVCNDFSAVGGGKVMGEGKSEVSGTSFVKVS